MRHGRRENCAFARTDVGHLAQSSHQRDTARNITNIKLPAGSAFCSDENGARPRVSRKKWTIEEMAAISIYAAGRWRRDVIRRSLTAGGRETFMLKFSSPLSPPPWWSKPSAILRYAIAVLSIALALGVAQLAVVYLNDEPFVTLFLCAIMFVAWFGGFGPGLFAAALAVLAFSYLLPPSNSFAVEIADLPRLVLFAMTALFANLLSASQRATAESLRRSRDELLVAIEDQRQVENALRRSETYLAEAQRLSHTGSFGRNIATGEVFWSEETFRIYEFNSAVTPSLELALQRVHPDDRASFQQLAEGASKDGPNREDEYRLLMPDGRIKYIRSLTGRAGREFSGTLTMVGAAMDVTERKQAEEALREARTEIAHATRVTTLGELTASIAHEVNQPLAGVVSSGNACLRWLANDPPNIENAKQSVERIIRDANRASEVVARVRSLAKKAPLQKGLLNLNDIVGETTTLTRMEVTQNRASLSTQLSDDAPLVWADRIQLQQVILNLIMNAVEAVSAVDGPRELFVSTAKHKSEGVLFTVRDSGTGLDPENVERIFEAFFTTKPEGMGMGLAVSRSIIEGHGGRLWASPSVPRGAVFQFKLPAGREEAL